MILPIIELKKFEADVILIKCISLMPNNTIKGIISNIICLINVVCVKSNIFDKSILW